ncbi:hypothetical protein GRI32_08210 [Altererythrobacter aestuarii]|uniref:Uncharacterized protein n=2 Tax=Alteraurantiacibacter aestuarii TaxID=650004 RepID=A0A844ZM93_9SPHN|nr:hypothetical protein [Alteraurantiacibacter aestuarii]
MALMPLANPAQAQVVAGPAAPIEPSYVELVELALAADIVARVQIDDQATLRAERAPDVAPGKVRIYAESITQALLGGRIAIGESLAFLVDLPADARGRAPKLKKQVFLIFARSVEGRPGQVYLAGQGAMQPATPALEQRVRQVLTQLAESARPPVITGVREAMSVPGNLVGESETQIFLETRSGDPVSLSVIRRPGMTAQWGVSWTDIVDQAARPPQAQTLEWYALACFLPADLPEDAFIQRDRESRDRAREDYRMVLGQLGPCVRNN